VSAVTGTLGLPAVLLYSAGIFWTLGYDTIYAHQDMHDDEQAGIKSTARLLAGRSPFWVALFYAMAVILLVAAGWAAGLGRGYFALLVFAVVYVAIQLSQWRMDDPANCRARFKSNRDFGLIVLFGMLIGRFL